MSGHINVMPQTAFVLLNSNSFNINEVWIKEDLHTDNLRPSVFRRIFDRIFRSNNSIFRNSKEATWKDIIWSLTKQTPQENITQKDVTIIANNLFAVGGKFFHGHSSSYQREKFEEACTAIKCLSNKVLPKEDGNKHSSAHVDLSSSSSPLTTPSSETYTLSQPNSSFLSEPYDPNFVSRFTHKCEVPFSPPVFIPTASDSDTKLPDSPIISPSSQPTSDLTTPITTPSRPDSPTTPDLLKIKAEEEKIRAWQKIADDLLKPEPLSRDNIPTKKDKEISEETTVPISTPRCPVETSHKARTCYVATSDDIKQKSHVQTSANLKK